MMLRAIYTSLLDKYGSCVWLVTCTGNPGMTPPGAGDVDTRVLINVDSYLVHSVIHILHETVIRRHRKECMDFRGEYLQMDPANSKSWKTSVDCCDYHNKWQQ